MHSELPPVERLEWDSGFFGFEVGRLDLGMGWVDAAGVALNVTAQDGQRGVSTPNDVGMDAAGVEYLERLKAHCDGCRLVYVQFAGEMPSVQGVVDRKVTLVKDLHPEIHAVDSKRTGVVHPASRTDPNRYGADQIASRTDPNRYGTDQIVNRSDPNRSEVDNAPTYRDSSGDKSDKHGHTLHITDYDASSHSYEQLLSLAHLSATWSRFRRDPSFGDAWKQLYRAWLDNSISGKIADRVRVVAVNDMLAGFITVSFRDGADSKAARIGLIAVGSTMQGKGVASALIRDAESIARTQGCTRMYVSTQQINTSAMALYERCGYRIDTIQNILHLWV